jgi:hypothetical protein
MTNFASIQDFNDALFRVRVELPVKSESGIRQASAFMARSIRERVSQQGLTSEGGSFSPYSKRHARDKAKIGNPPLGTMVSKKNFYFQGYLWSTFAVQSIKVLGRTTSVGIDFSGNNRSNVGLAKSNISIVSDNNEYEQSKGTLKSNGSLSDPSEKEVLQLVSDIEKSIYMSVENILGGSQIPIIP